MTVDQVQDIAKLVGAVVAIGSSAWGGYRWLWPRVAPYLSAFAALNTLPAAINEIRKEVKPNGGSSMRDELRRYGHDVRQLGATMRAYFENSDDGLFEADSHGRFSYINETLRRWCDRSRSDLFGFGWFSCVADHDRDKVRDEWLEAVAEKREFRQRFAMVSAAGNEFSVDVLARPVPDAVTGDVTVYVGHIRRRLQSGVQRAVTVDDGP